MRRRLFKFSIDEDILSIQANREQDVKLIRDMFIINIDLDR